VDKDPAAAAVAAELAAADSRFSFFQGSFAALPAVLAGRGADGVDGILLDLGVSSPQLDEPGRGFSFREDGPLDMRMDTTRGATAAEWLADAPEAEIARVLKELGEERFARRIAGALVRARAEAPIETTGRLAQIVSEANPRWEKHKHPATRSFQAIRIWINSELEDLRVLLDSALELLRVGGRLVIISFHSLEDRMVKRFMRDLARGESLPRGVPVRDSEQQRPLRVVGKAVRASEAEVAANPRARSAIMRTAERLA
jgi:16S rRNA (cytosine1402-N4)-methyltransferase